MSTRRGAAEIYLSGERCIRAHHDSGARGTPSVNTARGQRAVVCRRVISYLRFRYLVRFLTGRTARRIRHIKMRVLTPRKVGVPRLPHFTVSLSLAYLTGVSGYIGSVTLIPDTRRSVRKLLGRRVTVSLGTNLPTPPALEGPLTHDFAVGNTHRALSGSSLPSIPWLPGNSGIR